MQHYSRVAKCFINQRLTLQNTLLEYQYAHISVPLFSRIKLWNYFLLILAPSTSIVVGRVKNMVKSLKMCFFFEVKWKTLPIVNIRTSFIFISHMIYDRAGGIVQLKVYLLNKLITSSDLWWNMINFSFHIWWRLTSYYHNISNRLH